MSAYTEIFSYEVNTYFKISYVNDMYEEKYVFRYR
nr:ALPV-290 [Albatrosspox virus]